MEAAFWDFESKSEESFDHSGLEESTEPGVTYL